MDITNIVTTIKLPKELITVIISALPIVELRGALPIAVATFHFSILKAYLLSVLGNFLPVIPLLLFLDKISKWIMKYERGNKFFTWWFERTKKHSDLVEKFEAIGLILFVAVPLPATGAWTGCVAAYLFSMKKRHAVPAILLGIMIAGILVALATAGVLKIL